MLSLINDDLMVMSNWTGLESSDPKMIGALKQAGTEVVFRKMC